MYKVGDVVSPVNTNKFIFFKDTLLIVTSVAASNCITGGQLLGFYGKEPVWADFNFKRCGMNSICAVQSMTGPPDYMAITKSIAESS